MCETVCVVMLYLVITVFDDGKVEELAAVFFREDGVHPGGV